MYNLENDIISKAKFVYVKCGKYKFRYSRNGKQPEGI